MTVETLEARVECRIGHSGSVMVLVWFREPTVAALERFEMRHRELAEKFGKITLLSIIMGGLLPPGPEVRARIDQYTPELRKLRHGSVTAMLAVGLAAVFIRTFLAALALVSTEHMRVVRTLEAAALEIQRIPGQDEATRANVGLADELSAFVALPQLAGNPAQRPNSPPQPPLK